MSISVQSRSFLLLLTIACPSIFVSCEKEAATNTTATDTSGLEVEGAAIPESSLDSFAQLKKLPGQNAISAKCQECHSDIHHHWQGSHHGQANRLMDSKQDTKAFAGQQFHSGAQDWSFHKNNDSYSIKANDKEHHVGMAIGIDPIVQYLVAASDGKWQTPNASWDPAKKEWFDVFGGEKRTEADWGHFSGQGMNWNSQCAWCHMTDYEKSYDVESNTYQSHWKEMGIGCTQCHGQLTETAHAETGCLIDIEKQETLKQDHSAHTFDNCATCHSRRAAFDDHFKVGDIFGDHYSLQLPTQERLYYPDGQIRDEVYVWASLRTSNMGHKGVQCMDCHDPHTNQLKLPVANNQLCMSCHAGGTNGRISGAIIIDPLSHSNHGANSTGNSCVECHMTHTTYMGRDPRRDHGFHVPDPQMTKEHHIPNACNKCHTDQDVDWAIKWTNEWYGEKMNSPERLRQRARTRAIAAAYSGDPTSVEALLKAYGNEQNPYWQASLLQILQPWATDPRVQYLGRNGVRHEESIVRAAACQLMEFSTGNGPWLEPMLRDPIKEVRLAAAWAWRAQLSEKSEVLEELKNATLFNADQPAGIMRMVQLNFEKQNFTEAEKWIKRAIAIDQTSPLGYEYYAILLGELKRPQEAITQLQKARELAPTNGRYTYLMALAYGELGDKDKTAELLKESTKIDPQNDRVWYNLGLIYAEKNQLDDAIESIRISEQINPQNPSYPYARATLHLRKGDKAAAFDACRTVLGIDREHQQAIQLLGRIGNPNQ
ncbi:MAG: tetratricopeptide repeat protein [Akkermansiaceae bacterium]